LSLSIPIANPFSPSAVNFLGSRTISSDHESTVSCHAPIGARKAPKSNPYRRQFSYPYPIFPQIDVSPSHRSTPQWNLESGLADRRDLVVATIAPPFAFVFPSRFGSIHLDSSHPSDHRGLWRRMVKSVRGRSVISFSAEGSRHRIRKAISFKTLCVG
jgi:hypothetical protein